MMLHQNSEDEDKYLREVLKLTKTYNYKENNSDLEPCAIYAMFQLDKQSLTKNIDKILKKNIKLNHDNVFVEYNVISTTYFAKIKHELNRDKIE